MKQLIWNERLKLAASAFNTIAVSFIVTGIVVPAVSVVYGSGQFPGHSWFPVVWLFTALCLHALGSCVLGGLK
jgi:hypothetical protein